MKFNYQFSNLLGTVYRCGNLVFSKDGSRVFSPVGNKIAIFDAENHKCSTLGIESRKDIERIEISPDGVILITADKDGEIHIISLFSGALIHTFRTDRTIKYISFSPNSKYFALSVESTVRIYKSPGQYSSRTHIPLDLERVLKGAYEAVTCLEWSSTSEVLAVGSEDMTVRFYALPNWNELSCYSVGGLTAPAVDVFFELDSLFCYTIAKNGQLLIWENSMETKEMTLFIPSQAKDEINEMEGEIEDDIEDKCSKDSQNKIIDSSSLESQKKKSKFFYKRLARHFLKDTMTSDNNDRTELTAVDYHSTSKMMVTAFSNGIFFLHELPDVNLIHSLSISEQEISTVKINGSGDWIAFGSMSQGQLLVWEWQSETYILKQQSHYNNFNSLTYSPDSSTIATGGEDGKVKLWNTTSGFCFVTFKEHTSTVSGVTFSGNGKVLLSASFDGTVRAYDMARYRNFRTFTSPRPAQFNCLASDSSGQFVTAGSYDVYEIYLWSMQTGRLLEVIAGHEGPVSSLAFSPLSVSSTLISVSWDKTARIWNSLDVHSGSEVIQLGSDGLALAFKPDGVEFAVATLNGHIQFFDVESGAQTGAIEGRQDLEIGRSDSDLITSKKSLESQAFNALSYSADGSMILAGGRSKCICIYYVSEKLLVKKYEITQNRSLDAMDDIISRKKMCEFGNLALVEDRENETGIKLPGSRVADKSSRSVKPQVQVSEVKFSSSGREFAVASTEGILIYSLDTDIIFDPIDLTEKITPLSTRNTLKSGNYTLALTSALKLNEIPLLREVFESIPFESIQCIVRSMSERVLVPSLKFIGSELGVTKHIHFYSFWSYHFLREHSTLIQKNIKTLRPHLNNLQRHLVTLVKDLGDICNSNTYMIQFLITMSKLKKAQVSSRKLDSSESENDEENDIRMEVEEENEKSEEE